MKGFVVILLAACVASSHAQVNHCPTEEEEDWSNEKLLRHEDCNKVYKCIFGEPIEYTCYGNLYFNLEIWQCDWAENVDCEGRNIPEATTTTISTAAPNSTAEVTTTTTITTAVPTSTTAALNTSTEVPTTTSVAANTTIAAPNTTSVAPNTTTVAPVKTIAVPNTYIAAPATTTAAPNTTTYTEAATNTTTQARTTTVEHKQEEKHFLENGCPVNPPLHWLLPHETDCNLFYYCVWGKKVLRHCSATLHFNPVLQVCDWPYNAGCTPGLK